MARTATPRMLRGTVQNETRRVPRSETFVLPGELKCKITMTTVYARDDMGKEKYRGMMGELRIDKDGGETEFISADSWFHPKDREAVNALSEIRSIAKHDFSVYGIRRCLENMLSTLGETGGYSKLTGKDKEEWKVAKAMIWAFWLPKKRDMILDTVAQRTADEEIVVPPRKETKNTPLKINWKPNPNKNNTENTTDLICLILAANGNTAKTIAELTTLCEQSGWKKSYNIAVDEVRQAALHAEGKKIIERTNVTRATAQSPLKFRLKKDIGRAQALLAAVDAQVPPTASPAVSASKPKKAKVAS